MSYKYDPILMMNVPVKAEDASLGSVEDYYNKMVGKSKSEVEKIVMKAKGNPNADLAYKKWKATHGVNDEDFVESDECPEGMTCDASRDNIINKLRTVIVPEGKTFEVDNGNGWMAQIQNHGRNNVRINPSGKTSISTESAAWGRIWYNGKMMKSFEGPINSVKNDMINYLKSQTHDSKSLDAAIKTCDRMSSSSMYSSLDTVKNGCSAVKNFIKTGLADESKKDMMTSLKMINEMIKALENVRDTVDITMEDF